MTWNLAKDIILDALKDSGLVFIFVFILHLLLELFENKISNFLVKKKKTGPLFGSLFGLIPQCGTSVMGADLYIKKYITIGTLVAIFLSCSDEALISILTSGTNKAWMVIPLIILKFGIGLIVGLVMDLILHHQMIENVDHVQEEEECHTHHHENTKVHRFLVHPLIHSLQIFAYVLVINLALGFLIEGAIGKENFAAFIMANRYLTPLYASIIGLVPNCASSLLLAELFIEGSLPFGSLLAGLLVNAGLGMMMLLRNRKSAKHLLVIVLVCFFVAIISGYIACLISGF